LVIDEQTAAAILAAGGIKKKENLPELTATLDDIARAFLTARYLLRGSRGRVITKIGKPVRKQLMGDLAGAWIDLPGVSRIPGATWDVYGERFGGRFISFVQAYCGALADSIEGEQQGARAGDDWRSVAVDLRQMKQSPGKVREAMKLLNLAAFQAEADTIIEEASGKKPERKRFKAKKPH
jgi:hypothetical protein